MNGSYVTRGLAFVVATITTLNLHAQSGYTVTERGPDFKVLEKTTVEHGTNRVHRYVELATGLNYTNASGQLTESKEQITIQPGGGAAATQGRHKVYFPADIYNGVIEVVTPDGKHLKSRPLGISYDDGSNTVFIATLKNAQGFLTSSNQVTYRDAFTDFKADLVCTYRRGGFECDLVFRQQPPTPGDYGLDESFSTLSMVTEFFDTQDPQQISAASDEWFGLHDSTLKFGKLTMTHGKAFAFKAANTNSGLSTINSAVPVYKSWVNSGGRKFLIETVPVLDLAEDLNALPLTASIAKPDRKTLLASSRLNFPPSHELTACTNQILLASVDFSREPGVVLDYNAVSGGQTDYTLEDGQTYYVSGYFSADHLTIEPGAVIKFKQSGAGISLEGEQTVTFNTTPARPAIFTAVDDDSVGDVITGFSTHTPDGYYGDCGLWMPYLDAGTIHDLRFYYQGAALNIFGSGSILIQNLEFHDCWGAINFGEGVYGPRINNVLVENCYSLIEGGTGILGAQVSHVTATNIWGGYLVNAVNLESSSAVFKNCLLPQSVAFGYSYYDADTDSAISIATGGSCNNGFYRLPGEFGTLPLEPFRKAAKAGYYLKSNSAFRNAGTTSIDADALADIQTLTTYAPQDGGMPDTNAPDLGYHYPVNEDSDHDGLPDWWEWKWFGGYGQAGINHYHYDSSSDYISDGLGDYDNDGVNNLTEYLQGTDPNKISFSIGSTNDYVNHTDVTTQLKISGGVPSYYAVIVNSGTTNWLPFISTNIAANLGSTDGTYNVRVGLKGLPADATETWESYEFFLDRVAPGLAITNPIIASGAATTVIKPYLQLQGLADEPLASLSYDISNATGIFSNQDMFVHGQTFDTNVFDYVTNYFHASDVALATNLNWLTLRVTDRAGNTATTNFSVVLDYTSATNPPVVKLLWPLDGMAVSATNCTMRGTMSDETGDIVAEVVNGDGTTNLITAIVERNGMFWLENVPLNGTNQIHLQATDAAGNVTVTNFTVKPSAMKFKIAFTPEGESLYKPTGMVGGTVSDPNVTVTVNGAVANVEQTPDGNGDYIWIVNDAPVQGQGTATFDGKAEPAGSGGGSGGGGSSGGAANNVSMEMPSAVIITDHSSNRSYKAKEFDSNGEVSSSEGSKHSGFSSGYGLTGDYFWHGSYAETSKSSGGGHTQSSDASYTWGGINWTLQAHRESTSTVDGEQTSHTDDTWNAPNIPNPLFGGENNGIINVPGVDMSVVGWSGQMGVGNGYGPIWVHHFYAKNVKHFWYWDFGNGNKNVMEVTAGANTTATLFTGGKSGSKRRNLFKLTGSADEYGRSMIGGWANTPVRPTPKNGIRLCGQYANKDGVVFVVIADNETRNLQVNCPGIKHYNAGVSAEKQACNPVRLDFSDHPSAYSWEFSTGKFTGNFTLKVVCNKDWGIINYYPLATTITWGYTVDVNTNIQIIQPSINGSSGSCGTFIVDTITNWINYTNGFYSYGCHLTAHYIGCCPDGELNWVQEYTDTYNGGSPQPPQPDVSDPPSPYYYRRGEIDTWSHDYTNYEDWINNSCP